MLVSTLGDLLTQLNQELDLTDNDPITQAEKIAYINKGIMEAAFEIQKLGIDDQYFRAQQPLVMVTGQQKYGMPVNCLADKILKIVYSANNEIYEICRMRRKNSVAIELQVQDINTYGSSLRYQYLIRNDSPTIGYEIWLYPNSRETGANAYIDYIREPNNVVNLTDVVDIPEFSPFVVHFAKVKCLRKEFMGNPPEFEVQELQRLRALMIDTLREQAPDENNLVEQDVDFYSDFDSYRGWTST